MKNLITTATKTAYSKISRLGSALNLSFSSLMSLGNKTIALDGIRKKLLILENNESEDATCVIDLNEVKTVWLKKIYNSIKPGELKEKSLENFVESILLQFEYADEGKSISLPFYELGKNELNNLPVLERNARNWQMILSKMIAPMKPGIKRYDK